MNRHHLQHFGETARPWPAIAEFYRRIARQDPVFDPLAALVEQIVASQFPAAGLCGLTSMHELILGPSSCVLDNPHLVIAIDDVPQRLVLSYRDGSAKPWTRYAAPDELFSVVVRFLTRRARWFRSGTAPSSNS